MRYTIPHYYREFSCAADRCTDTCCAGWEIMIDPASLKKYRKTKGPLGNRLHNSIRWDQGSFKQYGRRCAFLADSGLCDLYSDGGPGMLCKTCRTYPRHIEEFEGVREISLCLSCIEAARIVLGRREPVRFLDFEREGEEDYGDFDFLLYTKLTDARELAVRILQDRSHPLAERASMALALAHDLQSRIRKNRLYAADQLLERYGRAGAWERFAGRTAGLGAGLKQRYRGFLSLTQELGRLEALNSGWPGRLAELRNALYGAGEEAYGRICREFAGDSMGAADGDWDIWGEQLWVYFVFTYFCGAVYDGRAYPRMKFAAACVLLIRELAMGTWALQGGRLDFDGFVDIAHRFSREVEHSDENREALLALLERGERFDLETMLSLIISEDFQKLKNLS